MTNKPDSRKETFKDEQGVEHTLSIDPYWDQWSEKWGFSYTGLKAESLAMIKTVVKLELLHGVFNIEDEFDLGSKISDELLKQDEMLCFANYFMEKATVK